MLQGSTKSGILGEIFLNLSNFLNIVDPTAISLPLKRCNSGTVLQVPSGLFITPRFQGPFGHCLHDLVAKKMLVLHSHHRCQLLHRCLFHVFTFESMPDGVFTTTYVGVHIFPLTCSSRFNVLAQSLS